MINFLTQDLFRLVANDELVTYGGTTLRGIWHDHYGFVHAANEPDLHGTFTKRASNSSHRGLDPLLQPGLELLVGVISRFVSLRSNNSITLECMYVRDRDFFSLQVLRVSSRDW